MRDYRLYIEDILAAIDKIEKFTAGLSAAKFQKNKLIIDAVIRNLEVIGEASKNIPSRVRDAYSSIEWGKITALRNILIHEYFGVDNEILWDIVKNKVPELKKTARNMLKQKNSVPSARLRA